MEKLHNARDNMRLQESTIGVTDCVHGEHFFSSQKARVFNVSYVSSRGGGEGHRGRRNQWQKVVLRYWNREHAPPLAAGSNMDV